MCYGIDPSSKFFRLHDYLKACSDLFLVFGDEEFPTEEEKSEELPCEKCEEVKRELDECKETARIKLQDAKAFYDDEMKRMQNLMFVRNDKAAEQEKENRRLESQVSLLKRKMEESLAEVKRYKDMMTDNANNSQNKKMVHASVVAQAVGKIVGKYAHREQLVFMSSKTSYQAKS